MAAQETLLSIGGSALFIALGLYGIWQTRKGR